MENKRFFECINISFSGSWLFRVGREYELYDDKKHPGYYTFKLSVDDGKPFICNAPKECFEEVEKEIKEPFTKEEKEVMDLLVEAHNKFAEIEQTHPSDIKEWVNGIHKCQSVLQGRVVRRDYPNVFK